MGRRTRRLSHRAIVGQPLSCLEPPLYFGDIQLWLRAHVVRSSFLRLSTMLFLGPLLSPPAIALVVVATVFAEATFFRPLFLSRGTGLVVVEMLAAAGRLGCGVAAAFFRPSFLRPRTGPVVVGMFIVAAACRL
jgi:hypothetical protein